MVEVYVKLILAGKRTLDSVPKNLKKDVEKALKAAKAVSSDA